MTALPLAWALTVAGIVAAAPPAPIPAGLQCLKAAYPATVCGVTPTTLELCDGTSLRWEDGRDHADFASLLEAPDLRDAMTQRYRPGRFYATPPLNHEPGRIRHLPLFYALYGDTRAEVRERLRRIRWMPNSGGRSVLVTTVNGVDRALERVSADLERELPQALKEIAAKTSGTFNWRMIRGTKRRSMHSFGIAIDVGVPVSDYWAWGRPDAAGRYRYKNRFPLEIVEIFERHGFVWGGKWYHFDSMHFEYRPELLAAPCALPPLAAAPPTQPPAPRP